MEILNESKIKYKKMASGDQYFSIYQRRVIWIVLLSIIIREYIKSGK